MHRVKIGLALLCLGSACGGGDGTAPPAVGQVVVSAPVATLRALTRTVQLTAEARTSGGAVISDAVITWSTSSAATATVSSTGLVTAVANGVAEIRATAGGVQSAPLAITVDQLAASAQIAPGSVSFGALGSTRLLSVARLDSANQPIPGTPAVTWSILGPGTTASISGLGLVTALATGTGDTALAVVGALSAKAPITVQQLVASVLVTSTGSDTLATTGRTKTYLATPRDSNANAIGGLTATWTSTDPAVATVGASTGIATAVADGSTNIRATVSSVVGQRALAVQRVAATFSLSPTSATLTTPSATQLFTGVARDSVDTDLPITWSTAAATIASTAPTSGTTTTVTAVGNGNTFLRMLAGTRRDSAGIAVSGQSTAPLTASVTVGDNFFRSVRNNTQNAAIDTIAVGGTVTWTWTGTNLHNVQSVLSPSFTSSALLSTGTYNFTFNAAGTYQYECQVHPSMTGRVVVR